jgi:hypothetical protein
MCLGFQPKRIKSKAPSVEQETKESIETQNLSWMFNRCCTVLDSYEEPPVPVLKKLEQFGFCFHKKMEPWGLVLVRFLKKINSGSSSSSGNQTWFWAIQFKTGI